MVQIIIGIKIREIPMKKKRNINLDIIRSIAVFSVLSVHFFLNNGFYTEIIKGKRMFVMFTMRTAFMICVPLFAILTGYLMNKKILSKTYYLGLVKTYVTYLLASIFCILFLSCYTSEHIGIRTFILRILNFSGAGYSWYVEMYIGLFLIIPFLNLIYNGLKDKKQKQLLVATMLFLTTIPTLLNIWGIDGPIKAIFFPTESTRILQIIPDYWQFLWPLTYYYIGCYLKEYGAKLSSRKSLLLFMGFLTIFGFFNFGRNYNNVFFGASYYEWYGFEPLILSVLTFICILNLDTSKITERTILYKCFTKISELSLGIYLVSSVFDTIIYSKLNAYIPSVPERLEYYVLVVPIVFLLSFITSYILHVIQNTLTRYVQKRYRHISNY